MSDLWRDACCRLGDAVLGWLLWLPRDAALVLLAVLSALLAVGLRRLVTDQTLLRRARQDQRRLKQLIRESRLRRDEPARVRYRRTAGAVALLRARQEARTLLVSLLPLAMLLTWAAQRFPYLPPAPQEPVQFVARLPSSAVGSVLHLVPCSGLSSEGGWIREVTPSQRGGSPRGTATWVLQAAASGEYLLTLRFRDRSFEHRVLIGQNRYAPTGRTHGGDVETELRLREYRPFGIAAGSWLPPWLLGYAVLVLIAYPLLETLPKNVFRRGLPSNRCRQ